MGANKTLKKRKNGKSTITSNSTTTEVHARIDKGSSKDLNVNPDNGKDLVVESDAESIDSVVDDGLNKCNDDNYDDNDDDGDDGDDDDDDDDKEEEEEEENDDSEDDGANNSIDEDSVENEDDSESASDDDSNSSGSSSNQSRDDAMDAQDEDDHSEGSQSSEGLEVSNRPKPVLMSESGEFCSFDLRNLLAMNTHQLNPSVLYSNAKNDAEEDKVTIAATSMNILPNEEYLLLKATEGCSQLISALWQLPVERSDAGPLVKLPPHDESRIPRALPPPVAKKETKWEKFAKEKGLPLNKEKRSRKVWDEATGTWLFRHGYQKANSDSKEWPIMEIKSNEDPFEDPWARQRDAKRTRVDKNREKQMKNEERNGYLAKGTTSKMMKNSQHRRNAGRLGGLMDQNNIPPAGVPVDLASRKMDRKMSKDVIARRGKESTVKALLATQRSTASIGKFDKMREGEPERKKSDNRALKRKLVLGTSTDSKVLSTEHERSMKLLKSVVEGGVQKEKDRKKGRLAKGETAYDYDYNDGLGASTFRKKKGRAGAGKMRKMTKKRIK